jgi:transcriptional regulator with XRE-family HTH domain
MNQTSQVSTDKASVLAQQLRRLRHQRKMTVRDLSIKSGVCKATIGAIENGRNTNPTKQTIDALAKALKAPVSELVYMPAHTLSEETESFYHLNPEEQDALERMKNDNPDIFSLMLRIEKLPSAKA